MKKILKNQKTGASPTYQPIADRPCIGIFTKHEIRKIYDREEIDIHFR